MSKAFTRESDDDIPDLPVVPRASASLPPGAKNYMTPSGTERLRVELDRLVQAERPRLVASSAEGDAKRRLQMLEQRIYELEQSLLSAEVVQPPTEPESQVRFGATVTVRERRSGTESQYRIVGVDEADFDRGWVSWISPIARALVNARLGQRVRFKFPSGEEELEIVRVTYE